VNIYDAQNTTLKVSRAAILRGWLDKKANLWRIPLVPIVLNINTETVLVNKLPTEFLPDQPPPIKAIHNLYKLKMQPELVQYLHALAGFPTKPTWIEGIKNYHYASWPGLTIKAVTKHFPKSKKMMKGHGWKGKSGLRSTKPTEPIIKIEPGTVNQTHLQASTKTHDIVINVFDIKEEAVGTIYTNQPGRFPKRLSKGNQYIMVLTHIDSNAILEEAMKNRTAGKMICAYQVLIN
jgi:hypothetical protein